MQILSCVMALLFCCCTYTVQALSSDAKLTLLVEENFPHATLNKRTGEIEGIEVDIITTLMARANIEYVMIMLPWNRAFRRAQIESDTCIFPINYTNEREGLFQWINPTQLGGWAIYKRPDSNITIKKIEDVAPYTIVGKMGIQANDQIESLTGKPVLEAATDIAATHLLYRGRADLLVSGIRDSRIAAKNAGLPAPKMAFNWKPAEFGLACSRTTNADVIDALKLANKERLALLLQ